MGLRAAVWLVAWLVACCPGSGLARTCRAAYRNTVNGVVHTACQPQNRNCTILKRGLSAADKKALLRRHNKLRSLVATGRLKGYKPAANMYELVWDDELAEVAQALADRCGDMSHDLASARFTRRFKLTGQNLATEQRSNQVMTVNWVRFIDRWFKEHKNYPPQQVKRFQPSFEGRPVGHFTQRQHQRTAGVRRGPPLQPLPGWIPLRQTNGSLQAAKAEQTSRLAPEEALATAAFLEEGIPNEEQLLQAASVIDKMRRPW
ncbi:antigen 5 like allergen Cul n 1-like isoform X2 [Haemaphysalis longicornis]